MKLLIISWIFFLISAASAAKIVPAKIFSDNMVLQRNVAIPVWGTANPGEQIIVQLVSAKVKTNAQPDGCWKIELPPIGAGGPYSLKIAGDSEFIEYNNVLIGDVWFASGQSNMEHPMNGWEYIPHSAVANSEQEIVDSNYPEIRLFSVPKYPCPVELKDLQDGKWEVAAPQSVAGFSSPAWFFAKELYKRLKVPVGIVHSSWGGTSIQPWMSRQSLDPYKASVNIPAIPRHFEQNEWSEKIAESLEKNRVRRNQISYPISGLPEKIGQTDFDDSNWKRISLLDSQCKFGNILWLRKKIDIPEGLPLGEFKLSLGFLNRQSQVFFNGTELGYFLYPQPVEVQIPQQLVHPGENILSIRLAQPWGEAQALGDKKQFFIANPDRSFFRDLSADWKASDQLESIIPLAESYQGNPSYLFNGMVAPVIPYAIKGFIWNQGESNAGEPRLYEKMFQQLIVDWRKLWNNNDLPFLFVQSSNIELSHEFDKEADSRCLLREAQQQALKLPKTGMVVSLDIGNPYDVHPQNKKEFGRRLALQALKIAYNQRITADGPEIESYQVKNDTIIIRPDQPLLIPKEMGIGDLTGFRLVENGNFSPVKAFLKNGSIMVILPKKKLPGVVYYAWTNNPRCSIFNNAGLPMAPFKLVLSKLRF
jgi:sialate O-acetylesterase